MVDKNEVKGAATEAGGKLKQAAGDLTGNERLKGEGAADEIEGKTQKNYGKVKDSVNDQTS